MMEIAAIIISVSALLFTIFSFYWMNWRRGKIIVGKPRTYALAVSNDQRMVAHFPFVFYNSGPLPFLVQNLRAVFLDEEPRAPLVFVNTVEKIGTDEGRAFATQFPINGREAKLLICGFVRDPSGRTFEPGIYQMALEAIFNHKNEWEYICQFELHITEKAAPILAQRFIVHDNMPDQKYVD